MWEILIALLAATADVGCFILQLQEYMQGKRRTKKDEKETEGNRSL